MWGEMMRGDNLENHLRKADDYLQQAMALRKIASEMRASDPNAAQKLIELAGEYEGKAEQLTLKPPT